jgi:predicted Zn-dependent protease
MVTSLAEVHAVAGNLDEAHTLLRRAEELSKHQYVASYSVARIYVALGQREDALHWLEAAYDEHAAMLIFVKVDQRFTELHSEPRFQDLVRRVNLRE